MTPLVFIDTETDGLHPNRRVWEVAMIRRDEQGDRERSFFVGIDLKFADPYGLKVGGFWDRHPSGRKMSGKPVLPGLVSLSWHDAAREVMEWTFDAHIVGINPSFDTETLARLLRSEGYLPSWNYHLVDMLPMAVGYLAGAGSVIGDTFKTNPPWKSDEISRWCDVEPPRDDDRHTALADARWAMRWYDAITGGAQ